MKRSEINHLLTEGKVGSEVLVKEFQISTKELPIIDIENNEKIYQILERIKSQNKI